MSTQDDLIIALEALSKTDTTLRRAVKTYGMPKTRRLKPGFATLAHIVVGQQLSTKAADAIWLRLSTSLGAVTAQNIIDAPDLTLKAAGLSGSKIKTLRALSADVLSTAINFRSLSRKADQEVLNTLTDVWGIGPWTAEIYLMFGMGRPDVWPAGDLALRTGWQILSDSPDRISAEDLTNLAEQWRPHRSAAAVLLWHAVGANRNKIALAKA